MKALRVDRRDHDHRNEVVDDGDSEHERAQSIREARPDESEQAEREGGVRRHRDPPAAGGATAAIEGEIDRDRRDHSADTGQERQREPPALT